MDIIKVDVPTFLRLLELAREDVKQDADLHDIVAFMKQQGKEDELDTIRRLGGVYGKTND